MNIRTIAVALGSITALALPSAAATITVAKDGTGRFSSVQEAVNAAGENDEVVILDTAVYEEQVTIDSSKNGLTLRSEAPLSVSQAHGPV